MRTDIITVVQMRAIDAAAAHGGTPTRTLMERAGFAAADAVTARFTPRATAVLCGPGNNGGDGFVVARALQERGWPVWIECAVPVAELTGDAADAARAWQGEVFPLGDGDRRPELYIDALFGAGLARPLTGVAARVARMLRSMPERVVAIDLPSGLNGDTGKPAGDACVAAALTVTFVRKKPAHLLYPGRELCGEVVVADIGVADELVRAQHITLHENDPALWKAAFPWPAATAHKHARGHVMVASGPFARTGAARLAARAALRSGAGLVTILSPRDAMAEHAAQLNAIMLRETEGGGAFADAAEKAQCLVIGPAFGVTPDRRILFEAVMRVRNRCPLVVDADAITLLSPIGEGALRATDVLTPHVGEFNRAFPELLEAQPSRVEAVRAAAAKCGAVVLLKGPDTVIGAPDGRAIINATGSPFMATAGSGDVLAGLIAGLVGQGMPSFEAAAAGAWLHGRAGALKGPGLIAEDISELLPPILAEIYDANEKF
ncbi:MAG: NAD(P)H-hydrate dehydratase [Hyphomonadaceae bacterium]|nr:NAD(P)H-hydrate dehydratase [Hyphomonadaceae bacterium]